MKKKIIALFDFDGTITEKDTMIEFIIFSFGYFKFVSGLILLSPVLMVYKLSLISNFKAKQILLSYFFKGMHIIKFNQLAEDYCSSKIEKIIKNKAMKRIMWHKKNGHLIVVVTASILNWIKPWCDKNQIEIIATELEVKNSIITGLLSTKNCYGKEKVSRIKQKFELSSFNTIYAYGDSKGDKEMLDIASNKHYRPF
jgi:phosphatidylglycerophosphatase C